MRTAAFSAAAGTPNGRAPASTDESAGGRCDGATGSSGVSDRQHMPALRTNPDGTILQGGDNFDDERLVTVPEELRSTAKTCCNQNSDTEQTHERDGAVDNMCQHGVEVQKLADLAVRSCDAARLAGVRRSDSLTTDAQPNAERSE